MLKNRVTGVLWDILFFPRKGLHTSWMRTIFWREEYEATAQASLRLKTEV